MGVSAQVQEAIAGWRKQQASSLDKAFADYKSKGLVRKARRGGGKNAIPVSRDECIYPVLGLPASSPTEAANTAQRFASLHCQAVIPSTSSSPTESLIEAVGNCLDTVAIPLSKGESINPESMEEIKRWELILCPDPFVAYIVSEAEEGKKETYFFHSGPVEWGALHSMTMFSGKLLLDLGEILADSYARLAREAASKRYNKSDFTKQGQVPESAGTLRQEEAPAPSENPTRATGSEGSHTRCHNG